MVMGLVGLSVTAVSACEGSSLMVVSLSDRSAEEEEEMVVMILLSDDDTCWCCCASSC